MISRLVNNSYGYGHANGTEDSALLEPDLKIQKPRLYKVLMHNDDYTPMDFVVHVLEYFFNKNHAEATQIMMDVHQEGVGVCGIYTYEIAETKVYQVVNYAQKKQHPLQCSLEAED